MERLSKMYLRFVSPLRSGTRGVDLGIFQCAIECRDNDENPEFIRNAVRREINWFNDYLPAPCPGAFEVKSRKRFVAAGICWFKSDAQDMIRHAYTLRTLLAECGYLVTRLRTRKPGEILYADDYQVVAKPAASTPTRWG